MKVKLLCFKKEKDTHLELLFSIKGNFHRFDNNKIICISQSNTTH